MIVKELEETAARLERDIAENSATVNHHTQVLDNLSKSIEQILARLPTNDSSSSNPTFNRQPQQNLIQGRPIRLDFPRFDGDDPESCLFQAEQFFNLNPMPAHQRVTMAAIHLKGDSVAWYRWLLSSMGELSWVQFSTTLCKRFGSRKHVDPMSSLSILTQKGTVRQYITEFENLINLVPGIQDSLQISLFLSGLRTDIQAGVRLLAPLSLSHACELAVNQEDAIQATMTYNKVANRNYGTSTYIRPTPTTTTQRTQPISSPSLSTGVKRLTWAEQKDRREKGLCFNWDVLFKPGHRCSKPQLLLLDASLHSLDDGPCDDYDESPDADNIEVSLHALTGTTSPTTMRVSACFKNKPLFVLLDSGSTHNFLHPSVARRYGIPLQQQHQTFKVMIADGGYLPCAGSCRDVPLEIQGYMFTASFSLLDIKGCDMVLGIQWLRTLGCITWDFEQLIMQFTRHTNLYTIIGHDSPMAKLVDSSVMQRALSRERQGFLLSLQMTAPLELSASVLTNEHDSIKDLLDQFKDVFGNPNSLPHIDRMITKYRSWKIQTPLVYDRIVTHTSKNRKLRRSSMN